MKKLSLIFAILLFATGCGQKSTVAELSTINLFAMNTYMNINISTPNTSALEEIEEFVMDLDRKWSPTNESSEIFKLNLDKTAVVSSETIELLEYSKMMSEKTDGAFDISIYPIMKAWGFTTGENKVPLKSEINEILSSVNYNNITIDNKTVTLLNDCEIAFGSIAKGYLSNGISDILKEHKIESALLDLGGNICVVGTNNEESLWNIGIKSPILGDILAVLQASDKHIITSGGYERYFTDENNNSYWHIMDPKTGYPSSNGILSTTIISDDGTYADALSTSLFVMGVDDAIKYYQNALDFDFIIITEDTIYITKNIQSSFTISDVYSHLKVEIV